MFALDTYKRTQAYSHFTMYLVQPILFGGLGSCCEKVVFRRIKIAKLNDNMYAIQGRMRGVCSHCTQGLARILVVVDCFW